MRKNKCGISTAQKWAGTVQIKGGAACRSRYINKDLVAPDRAVKSPKENITRKKEPTSGAISSMQEEEENRSKERTRPSKNKLKIITRRRNKLWNRPESSTVRKLWPRKGCENRWGGEMENKEVKSREPEQVSEKEEE